MSRVVKRLSYKDGQVVYTDPAVHDMSNPFLLSLSSSQTTTGYTIRAKVVKGDVDAAGVPKAQNTILTMELRKPFANDAGHFDLVLTMLKDLLSDPSVMGELKTGYLPQSDTLTLDLI